MTIYQRLLLHSYDLCFTPGIYDYIFDSYPVSSKVRQVISIFTLVYSLVLRSSKTFMQRNSSWVTWSLTNSCGICHMVRHREQNDDSFILCLAPHMAQKRKPTQNLKKKQQKANQSLSAPQLYNLSVDKILSIIFPIVEFTDIFNKKT